jgi:2-aminoadipate transaminase
MEPDWEQLLARRTARMRASDIREILKVTVRPEIISLAGGLPAPELFPVEEIRQAYDRILESDGAQALQYGASEGYQPLRELVAARLTGMGTPAEAEQVLITSGSQQGLSLMAKLFLDPGDLVLCENPTYLGAVQAFDSYEAAYRIAGMDDEGMRSDEVDGLLADGKVKLIYALPNFQNPSGRTMSLERRRRLVEAARRHGVPILEDDPYGELRFEGEPLPSLRSLWPEGVVYLGTFSKILAPGFRLAWVVAPPDLFDRFVLAKQPADLHTATITQMAAYAVAKDEAFLAAHVEQIRDVYRERRDAMLRAMGEWFPPGCRWTRAAGGMFTWVELPGGLDARELLVRALEDQVAFVPGQAFHTDGSGANTLRLNFSNVPPERIEEGIRRLGSAIAARLGRD